MGWAFFFESKQRERRFLPTPPDGRTAISQKLYEHAHSHALVSRRRSDLSQKTPIADIANAGLPTDCEPKLKE